MTGWQDIKRAASEKVLQQMPAAVIVVEAPSGKIIFRNSRAQQWREESLSQARATKLEDAADFDVFHPDGRPYEIEEWPLMRSIRDGEEVRDEEFVYPLADGRQLSLSCDSSPIYDDGGHIVAGVLQARDITGQMRAEEKLQEAHRRTENILESITDAFYAVDREWRFTYINERALRYMQAFKNDSELTREELLGKNMWDEFSDAVSNVFHDKYHEAMREQKSVDFEAYYPTNDVWFEVHAYPSEERLSFYWRDITERKRAQEKARFQAELLAAVGQAVIATDLQGHITYWNTSAQDIYGWSAEEVIGRPIMEVTVSEAQQERAEEIISELRAGRRWSGEFIVRRKDGTSFPATVTDTPVHDEHGRLIGIIGVSTDMTEFKRAEQRLERSRIARDLHDEPLQDLVEAMVQVQQIQSFTKDPQELLRLARLLATLDRIGPQLRRAIYDLRLEGELTQLFPELLESLVELHRGLAPESDIILEVGDGVLSGPLGELGREVLRILGEALTNVRRHSGAENVSVSVGITKEMLWAEVEDDGRGFDAAESPEQALSATGGLGIRGMRERARALGGDIRIESEPPRGTKVRFQMALKKDYEEPEEEERVRILLVEDHASIREALASTFEGEGFEVVDQAGSMAEARGMLAETGKPIDVALIDLSLPDGDGADLIKELREAHPQAQALVLSATLDRAKVARAVDRGAAGVLSKTTRLGEVVESISRLRAGETLMPLEEVVELLRFAGGKREEEHEARQALAQLTPREKEVLQTLAEGLDTRAIAERLNMSVRTERNHMASVMVKLGVHSQLQALVFALRYGVVEIP